MANSVSVNITCDQSVMMRGMAITMIVLHNFCPLLKFTVKENESSFSKENVSDFFNQIAVPSNEWLYNFFSFLGWYGVPVFIFLTGFGLVRKYEDNDSKPMNKNCFLFHNWLKLFALLLPGVLYYICFDLTNYLLSGDIDYIINIYSRVFLLTFLNDIFGLWVGMTPGIYWYFGLTLELYFLYAILIYHRPIFILLIVTIASLALQIAAQKGILGDPIAMLWWIRQNFTGWIVPFAFGIIYGRIKKNISCIWLFVIGTISIILFFPSMCHPVLWQISLLCAIIFAIIAARLSINISYWRTFWLYIGRMSPFIFAAQPIVRGIIDGFLSPARMPNGFLLVLYSLSVMFCAIIYKSVWVRLSPILNKVANKCLRFHA